MPIVKKNAIINGTPYLHDVGVNAGKSLGNVAKLTYAVNLDKKVSPNFQGGGGNDDVFYQFKDGTVSLEVKHLSIDLFLLALGGISAAVAAGAVADEPHTVVELDSLIAIDHLQDMSIPLTVKDSTGVTTYDEGTHYLRKRGGIIPLSNDGVAILNGIDVGDTVKIGYTKHKHQRVQALINTITEKGLLFDGINERTNAPWMGRWHRIGWGPTKSLEFISQDFMSFVLEGEILKYEGITDPTKSQFLELLVGDL